MDEITILVKAIAEYGVLVIIAAIFLYAAIRVVNIFVEWLKSKVGKGVFVKHDQTGLNARTTSNKEIYAEIKKYVINHDVRRFQIMEFSNTVMSVAYLPFKYVTCTYETRDMGDRKELSGELLRTPTSLYSDFFAILHDGIPHIFDITDDTNYPMKESLRAELLACGETKAMCIMLESKDKHIGYTQVTSDVDFNDQDISDFIEVSKAIAASLSVMDK